MRIFTSAEASSRLQPPQLPHDNAHCKPVVNVPHFKIRVLAGLSVRRDRRIERRE
jgi:hypothetical protein